ncbi:MAG: hypothetical protein EZS28_002652, partial [Streblomastix strix]
STGGVLSISLTRFVATSGSHTGGIHIQGDYGDIKLSRVLFSLTKSEHLLRYTPDASFGTAIYLQSSIKDSNTVMPRLIQQNFIQCYSDSKIPMIGYWSSIASGSVDTLLRAYQNNIYVSEVGNDINNIGTQSSPFRTLKYAIGITNPKKDQLNSGGMNEQQLANITISNGMYKDSQVAIMAEYILVSGNGTDNTIVTNIAITSPQAEDSCILYISADNKDPEVEITQIHFQQSIIGLQDGWGLIKMNQGKFTVKTCKFSQTDPSIGHNFNYIELSTPHGKLISLDFIGGKFNEQTSAVFVNNGGVFTMEDCTFINIQGSSAMTIDITVGEVDMQIRRCRFERCQTSQTYSQNCSKFSSAIVLVSRWSYPYEYYNNKNAYLLLPVVVFTSCTFQDNKGEGSGCVEIKGQPIVFGFSLCNFSGNSILATSAIESGPNDVVISSYGVGQSGQIFDMKAVIQEGFGSCNTNAGQSSIKRIIYASNPPTSYVSISPAPITIENVDIKMNLASVQITKYVRSGGNDDNSGDYSSINSAYETVSRSFKDQFYGSDNPVIVDIGIGTFNDDKLNVGSRGIKIIGKGIGITTMINLKDNSNSKAWLVSTVGGLLDIENMTVKQVSSIIVSYGGMIIIRGDGLIILDQISIEQLDLQQKQISNEILCTSGSVKIMNCIFGSVNYGNTDQFMNYATGIKMQNTAENLDINNTLFTQQISTISFTDANNAIVRQNYLSGCIVINHAENVRISYSNFSQNEGWRTGCIQSIDIRTSVLYLQNCKFERNKATAVNEQDIGNDIILDHQFKRNNIADNFLNSQSTSAFPKIGSKHQQYEYGVFDFLFDISMESIRYVNKQTGKDLAGYGTEEKPYSSLSYAISLSSSRKEYPTTLQTSGDQYIESNFFIGGRAITIEGYKDESGLEQQVTVLQNADANNENLFTVFNGTLNLQQLVVQINNKIGQYHPNLIVVSLVGSECIFSSTSVIFRTMILSNVLKKQFISTERGCSISLQTTSFENIQEQNEPIIYLPVEANIPCEMHNTTILGYGNQKAESSSVIIEHYGGGLATLNNCNFKFNIVNSQGTNVFGAALTIQFNIGGLTSTAVELTNCVFDTNIGECCGAITIQGVSTALTSLLITSCTFMNNVAYAFYKNPSIVYANDIYFDMSNVQNFLGSSESTIFTDCVSYSVTPKINYLQNIGSPADNVLGNGSSITGPSFIYVSGSGSDSNGTGSINSPYQSLPWAYARVDKKVFSQIFVQIGLFDISYIVMNNVKIFIQGAGYALSTLTNKIMKEQGMFWLQSGAVMHLEDFTFIPAQCQSENAPMFEVSEGGLIRIRRCNIRSEFINGQLPDVKTIFFNSPILRVNKGSGSLLDIYIYSIYFSKQSPFQILLGEDDLDWNSSSLPQRLQDSYEYQQSASAITQNTNMKKFEINNITLYQVIPYKNVLDGGIESINQFDGDRHEFYPSIKEDKSNWPGDKSTIGSINNILSSGSLNPYKSGLSLSQLIFEANRFTGSCARESHRGVTEILFDSVDLYELILDNQKISTDLNDLKAGLIMSNNIYGGQMGGLTSIDIIVMGYINTIDVNKQYIIQPLQNYSDYGSTCDPALSDFCDRLMHYIPRSEWNTNINFVPATVDPSKNIFTELIQKSLIQFAPLEATEDTIDSVWQIELQQKAIYEEIAIMVPFGHVSIKSGDSFSNSDTVIRPKVFTMTPDLQQEADLGFSVDPYEFPLLAVENQGQLSISKLTIEHYRENTMFNLCVLNHNAETIWTDIIFRPHSDRLPDLRYTLPYVYMLSGTHTFNSVIFEPTLISQTAVSRLHFESGMIQFLGVGKLLATFTKCQFIDIDLDSGVGAAIKSNGNHEQKMQPIVNEVSSPPNTAADIQLVETCGWNQGYVSIEEYENEKAHKESIINGSTHFIGLQNGALHIYNTKVSIDKNVIFSDNISPLPQTALAKPTMQQTQSSSSSGNKTNSTKSNQMNNMNKILKNNKIFNEGEQQQDDEWEQFDPLLRGYTSATENTLYRRNILCGHGSEIIADSNSFSEDGIQGDSLWILKTNEGNTSYYQGTDQLIPQCKLIGTVEEKPYSLFVPKIENANAKESKDKYGADITIKGNHFVRCGMMQYEICEYEKSKEEISKNVDTPPTEEEATSDPHEEHCQRKMMEYALDWKSEQEIVIQSRYKVVRKWKKMDVRIIYGEGQSTETFVVSTENMSAGLIVAMTLVIIVLVCAGVGLLIGFIYFNHKMKAQKIEARKHEDEQMIMDTNPTIENENKEIFQIQY